MRALSKLLDITDSQHEESLVSVLQKYQRETALGRNPVGLKSFTEALSAIRNDQIAAGDKKVAAASAEVGALRAELADSRASQVGASVGSGPVTLSPLLAKSGESETIFNQAATRIFKGDSPQDVVQSLTKILGTTYPVHEKALSSVLEQYAKELQAKVPGRNQKASAQFAEVWSDIKQGLQEQAQASLASIQKAIGEPNGTPFTTETPIKVDKFKDADGNAPFQDRNGNLWYFDKASLKTQANGATDLSKLNFTKVKYKDGTEVLLGAPVDPQARMVSKIAAGINPFTTSVAMRDAEGTYFIENNTGIKWYVDPKSMVSDSSKPRGSVVFGKLFISSFKYNCASSFKGLYSSAVIPSIVNLLLEIYLPPSSKK